MKKSGSKSIGGVTFGVEQLGFGQARALFVYLSKKAGPVIAALAGAPSLQGLDVSRVVRDALESLDEADLEHVSEILGEVTTVTLAGGKRPQLDRTRREAVFSDLGLLAFFQWLWFALEIQFGDFFAALRPSEPDREGATPASSPDSRTS